MHDVGTRWCDIYYIYCNIHIHIHIHIHIRIYTYCIYIYIYIIYIYTYTYTYTYIYIYIYIYNIYIYYIYIYIYIYIIYIYVYIIYNISILLRRCNLNHSVHLSGSAAEAVAELKIRKYSALATSHHFVPFAIEALGPICKSASDLISEISLRYI